MNKNKNSNQNKGITLIALVITIIVMLILVAVTISIAVNGGLFDYAGKAAGYTNNAIKAEQQLARGKIKVGEIWYDSIGDYINNKPSTDQGDEEEPEEPAEASITLNIEIIEETLAYDAIKTVELEATLSNIEGNLTWTSSAPAVAEIQEGTGNKRTIKLIGEGKGAGNRIATITVSNGTISKTCTVTVKPELIPIQIGNITCYREEEMTWGDWVNNSTYNTVGAKTEGEFIALPVGTGSLDVYCSNPDLHESSGFCLAYSGGLIKTSDGFTSRSSVDFLDCSELFGDDWPFGNL